MINIANPNSLRCAGATSTIRLLGRHQSIRPTVLSMTSRHSSIPSDNTDGPNSYATLMLRIPSFTPDSDCLISLCSMPVNFLFLFVTAIYSHTPPNPIHVLPGPFGNVFCSPNPNLVYPLLHFIATFTEGFKSIQVLDNKTPHSPVILS